MTDMKIDPYQIKGEDGLVFGCILDGRGGAKLVGWDQIDSWKSDDGPLWIHMDRSVSRVHRWLREKSGLTETTLDAMLAEETRPRVFRGKRGFISILRGINNNPGDDPTDLVAIRMWSDGNRVITIRHRKLMSARDILFQLLVDETGPQTAPQLYERLISRLIERMGETIEAYDGVLDEIEEKFELANANDLRRRLSDLRHDTVNLRRYLAPQRDALQAILLDPPDWADERSLLHLRETSDRLLRYVEELDALRERSLVIKDDIANRLSESSNKTLYILAIISGIFLPLAFLTGLLGINVGGMPGVENPYAFWIFCGIMAVLLTAEIIIFKRLKWL